MQSSDGRRPEKAHLAALGETLQASHVGYIDEYQNIALQVNSDRTAKNLADADPHRIALRRRF